MKIGIGANNIHEVAEHAEKTLGPLLPEFYNQYPEMAPDYVRPAKASSEAASKSSSAEEKKPNKIV